MLLFFYVIGYNIGIVVSHCRDKIAVRPEKMLFAPVKLLKLTRVTLPCHPGRPGFENIGKLCQFLVRRGFKQDMDVVLPAVYLKYIAATLVICIPRDTVTERLCTVFLPCSAIQ